MRRTRYRGLAKTHLQHVGTAAAINVQRILDWLWEIPRSTTLIGSLTSFSACTGEGTGIGLANVLRDMATAPGPKGREIRGGVTTSSQSGKKQ